MFLESSSYVKYSFMEGSSESKKGSASVTEGMWSGAQCSHQSKVNHPRLRKLLFDTATCSGPPIRGRGLIHVLTYLFRLGPLQQPFCIYCITIRATISGRRRPCMLTHPSRPAVANLPASLFLPLWWPPARHAL